MIQIIPVAFCQIQDGCSHSYNTLELWIRLFSCLANCGCTYCFGSMLLLGRFVPFELLNVSVSKRMMQKFSLFPGREIINMSWATVYIPEHPARSRGKSKRDKKAVLQWRMVHSGRMEDAFRFQAQEASEMWVFRSLVMENFSDSCMRWEVGY